MSGRERGDGERSDVQSRAPAWHYEERNRPKGRKIHHRGSEGGKEEKKMETMDRKRKCKRREAACGAWRILAQKEKLP